MTSSKTYRIAFISTVIVGIILLFPSPVAAQDYYTEELFNSSDNFGVGDAEKFNVTETETAEQIKWKIETEAHGDNTLLNDDSLHIYIDTDNGETGLGNQTVQSSRWGNFFDGLSSLNADYRIRVSDVGSGNIDATLEEHDTDVTYEEVDGVEYNNGEVTLNKEAIGSPDRFGYNFVYIAAPREFSIEDNQFVWGPDSRKPPQFFEDGKKPTDPITIEATADFTAGEIDADSVTFRLESGSDGGPNKVKEVEPSPTESVNETFTLTNLSSGSELFVTASGSERYPFERTEEMNNSVEVGELDPGDSAKITIDISRIEAEVVFGDKKSGGESASGYFELDNSSVDNVSQREFDYDGEDPLVENFTVNPNDFEGGEIFLEVEEIGDNPDYGFRSSEGVTFSSPAEVEFNAGQLDYQYDFKLLDKGEFNGYNAGNPDVLRDNEFTMMVNLSGENVSGSIQELYHTTEFDPETLNVRDVNVNPAGSSTLWIDNPDLFDNKSLSDFVDQESGEIDIEVISNTTDSEGEAVANETHPLTYNITFGFVDGLEEGEIRSEDAVSTRLEITNVTLTDQDRSPLSAIRAERSVELENSETRVTNATITHLTEGGDMVGSQMKYEVDISTNNGRLGNVSLRDANGKKIAEDNFDGDSGGTIELNTSANEFNYQDVAISANNTYEKSQFNIIIEDNLTAAENHGDSNVVYNATEDLVDAEQEDVLEATIYKKYDVDGNGQNSTTTADVVAVAERVSEDGVDELPWPADDKISARADLDNTGEVTSSNLATIVGEWDQSDFVDEVNATVDEDPRPNIGIGSENDTNVTVFDYRRGEKPFDADQSTTGGNVTVDQIDDGGDDVTVKNLSEGETQLVEEGSESFEDVRFINADDGDTVNITFSVTNDVADPDPEGTKETITIELNGAIGENVSAELDNSNVPETEFNLTNYELKNYGDGGGDAENVTNILVEVEDTEQGPVNFTGDAIGYDGPGEENGGPPTNDGRLLVNLSDDTNRFPADEQFNDLIGNVDITVPENTTDETLNVTVTLLDAGTDVDERSDFDADSDEVGATSVTEKVLKVNLLANGSLDADLNETETGGGDLKTALNISHTVENASALNVNTINITRENGGTGALNFSGDTNSTDNIDTLNISNSSGEFPITTKSVSNVTNSSDDVVALEIDIPEQNIYNGSEVILNTSDDIVEVGGGNGGEADIGIELRNGSGIIEDTKDTDTVKYNTTA